jgi:tetratricopeptide (TPR) repeat protein
MCSKYFYITFSLLLILPMCGTFGQVDPISYSNKLRNEFKRSDNDSIKLERLFDLAFFYSDYMMEDQLADSISQVGIRIAEASHRPELQLIAYNRYIESNNLIKNNQKALDFALKAEQVSSFNNNPAVVFRNYKNLISVYLTGYEYDKALACSYKSLSISTSTKNIKWQAESYLNIGKSLEGKNQKIEAFRNYLNAVSIAEQIKNTDLQIECYARLSDFYNLNKLYFKAIQYKLRQSDLVKKTKPIDSVALMRTKYDLQVIDINSNNNHLDEGLSKEILDFARRKKHNGLLTNEITLIRNHLIAADKIDVLQDLYYKQFPLELKRMASYNAGLYNRLKAYFCEKENRPDSAFYYFNKAESIMHTDPNKILQSNFYNRFGQFLLRQGQKDRAIAKFSKSYELANEASYFEYMLRASKQLELIYADKGDYKNAYTCSVLNKVLSDSLNNMSKKDQMLIMEIDHETRQRELTAEAERESRLRRDYLEYTAMIIIIISVFFVLLMLGSLKVPEWIIKMLGFFSFIFLFEFIVLIADHKILEITSGEPWKILLIKIFLIAILLPMHQWIERHVIKFLLDPGLINISQYSLRRGLKGETDTTIQK